MKLGTKIFISFLVVIFIVALGFALFKKPKVNTNQNLDQIYSQSVPTPASDETVSDSSLDSSTDVITPDGSVVVPDEVHEMLNPTPSVSEDIITPVEEEIDATTYIDDGEGDSTDLITEENYEYYLTLAICHVIDEDSFIFYTDEFKESYDSMLDIEFFKNLEGKQAEVLGVVGDFNNSTAKVVLSDRTEYSVEFTIINNKISSIYLVDEEASNVQED